MTRKKRRILFYIFSLAFIISIPILIFYALGLVPDFSTFTLVKTGGIFVKSKTTGLRVFLNNEFKKETSFLSGGALLTDIKPNNYIIKIEKEGSRSWYKSVEVLPEQVIELRSILILPKKIDKKNVENRSKLISISPNGSLILIEKKRESSKTLLLSDFENNTVYPIAQTSQQPILKVIWSGEKIILKRDNEFSVINKNENGSYEEEVIKSPAKNSKIVLAEFYPKNNDSIAILDLKGILYLYQNNSIKKLRENINSFGVNREEIFFIDKNGFFAKIDIASDELKVINRPGFFLSQKPAQILFSPNGDIAIIDASGGLFFISKKEENIIHTVAGEVRGAEFDSLGKKLLFWTPTEIKVFWVEPNAYQPFQKEFITEPVFKLDSGIKEASWFTKDDFHIIIRAENGIYITEIDGRGGRNTIELTSKKTDKILWDKNSDKLYFSSDNGVEAINL